MSKTVKVLIAVLVAACVGALGYNIFLDPPNRWGAEQPAETSVDAGVQTSTVGSSTTAQ